MLLSPVILFVYNRLEETQKTVEALRQNILAPDSDLFIFSDAPKNQDSSQKVQKVRKIIHSIDGFKSVTIVEAEKNKGLAHSIIDGVSQIIKKYGKVIVLEDDLITSPNFLSFMNQALDYYEENEQVISISGCTFHIKIPATYAYDVYFTRRMSSYGWGTWLNRWKNIDWELKDYDSFRWNLRKNLQFMHGGEDLPRLLAAYKKGKINSWAIRFTYHQYKMNTYTVYPTVSKVNNIGFNIQSSNTKRMKYFDRIDFSPTLNTHFRFSGKVFTNKRINWYFLLKYRNITRFITNYILRK